MKYILLSLISFLIIACDSNKTDPFKVAVQTEVTNIMTKEIASTGTITSPVQVENVKIEKISKKEYYEYEWNEQDKLFKKFLEFAKKKNFPTLLENQLRHDSVMSCLEREKSKAPTNPDIYKVDYNLQAATGTAKYDQPRTIFLDSNLHKVVINYNF